MPVTNDEIHLSIGDVSERVGTSTRTIRYYEEIGLIGHPKRKGNRRFYAEEDVRRLKFIKRLKLLGLSLAEMAELRKIYSIHRSNGKVLLRLLELLDSHSERIDRNIHDLSKLKQEISSYKDRIARKLDSQENHDNQD